MDCEIHRRELEWVLVLDSPRIGRIRTCPNADVENLMPSIFVILLASVAAQLALAQAPVRVEGGLILGEAGEDDSVRVYRGIPYAAPPVGMLRWRPPQPVPAWDGVRKATEFASMCWQDDRVSPEYSFFALNSRSNRSEDCLYLNVWAPPSSDEPLPVMVWIHGGNYLGGSASDLQYHGENLARRGVVVVTINYRLQIFGFFAHPGLSAEDPNGSSGNYAILDQIAALRWVQSNIAAFGGDPGNVTIFGESAGSFSVNYLLASPLARGTLPPRNR